MYECPYMKHIIEHVTLNTQPFCFHCGQPYIKDNKYCDNEHNTWKPDCDCLTTTAVRIVTGGNYDRDINNYIRPSSHDCYLRFIAWLH